MNFISILYSIFLLSVLGIYWSVNSESHRLWIILMASIVLYASLQPQYLPLLAVLTLINYQLGVALGQNTAPGRHNFDFQISNIEWQFAQADWNRRRWKIMWLGIILNLLILATFKYLEPFLKFISTDTENTSFFNFQLIAPLGISYFIFECIAYLVDVYRGAPATKNWLKFAAYKIFFVKIASGPITRFHHFAHQLHTARFPGGEQIADALWLIARGALKKGILADNIGVYVDLCFGNIQRVGSGDLWLSTFAYGLQLYLDFSGYVDIARGGALLFGINLPQNFDAPYFSTSIAEFWRRWHMTLGDWLRNYLYFPLGGSRQGLTRTCINLIIVMLIAGIWHVEPRGFLGFVIWGLYHGIALAIHRITDVLSDRTGVLEHFWQSPLGILLAWLLTQLMVFTAWIWFRLPNLQDSLLVFQRLFNHKADPQFIQQVYVEALKLSPPQLTFLLMAIATLMSLVYLFNRQFKLQFNWPVKILFVPICFYLVAILAPEGNVPFIYFNY